MNRNQRVALAEMDLQVKDIGNILGKNSVSITNCFSGRLKSPGLRRAISEILQKPENHLWPEEENGKLG